jgi:hypothetical protein
MEVPVPAKRLMVCVNEDEARIFRDRLPRDEWVVIGIHTKILGQRFSDVSYTENALGRLRRAEQVLKWHEMMMLRVEEATK